MIYQWRVSAIVNGNWPCEFDVLATNDKQAKEVFESEIIDWIWGTPRYKSVEKTGMVLVPEGDVKK